MARLAGLNIVNVPHHITQRGNARQFLLATDDERIVYLSLLRKYVQLYALELLGYCLMSNHVHLIVVPTQEDSLAQALKHTHGRYATYWNAVHRSTGHAWQGRFYSCPLDEAHLWMALRYTERNPVRGGLVAKADQWAWSSAAVHCGSRESDFPLEMGTWNKRWSAARWSDYLADGETIGELRAIRQCTHTGRPLGSAEFIKLLERTTRRRLVPQKGGRSTNPPGPAPQTMLAFEKQS